MTQINSQKLDHITYQFSDAWDEVSKDWNLLRSDNIYLEKAYLDGLHSSLKKTMKPYFCLVYASNQCIAKFYFQHIYLTQNTHYSTSVFNKNLSRLFSILQNKKTDLLVSGNLFSTGEDGMFSLKNLNAKIHEEIFKGMTAFVEKKNRNTPTLILIKDLYTTHQIHDVLPLKFHKFKVGSNMVLKLNSDWFTFDDYLSEMVTKYRNRAKKVIKKTKNLQQRPLTLEDLKIHQNRIFELYNSVIKRSSFSLIKFNPTSFYELKKSLNHHFVVTGYFFQNKLVGFSTATIQFDKVHANFVGVDTQLNLEIPIYQRILYDYVKLAIDLKKKELQLGRTAELIKSALGALPVEMFLYLKHKNSMINLVVPYFLNRIKNPMVEIRKPFKKNKRINI